MTTSGCKKALEVAYCFGGIDGDHHKTWCIDQIVRHLTGDKYKEWVAAYEEDGYTWNKGIAP